MSERFDDMVRKQLEAHESPVPQDMFDKIRKHPDVSDAMFDASVKNTFQSLESIVAADMFEQLNAGADLTNAPFDGAVKQILAGIASPVPADMWERINERKRRRRPVAWWWMAAGLLLMIAGGTWYVVHSSKGNKVMPGNDTMANKKIASSHRQTSANHPLAPKKYHTPVITDTTAITNDLSQKQLVANKETFVKEPAYQNDKSVETLTKKNILQKEFLQKEILTTHTIKNYKGKNGYNLIEKNSNIFNLGEGHNTEPGSHAENTATTAEDFISFMSTAHLAINQQLRNAARLTPAQLMKAKPRSPVIPCPVNADEGHSKWYADIYTSAFMFNKNISDKTADKNTGNGFDSTLHRQVSFNAGVSLVKNVGENILLKTGIQYNRLNESFRLIRINERRLVTTISVRVVIIAPGDTVYIRDTSVTEKIGTIQRRKQNIYQQWDVPVIIGYEFGGENIRLNANAGIIANIRSSYSGELLDTMQQVIDAKNYNGKPIYKTNVGLSLYAGLSILKPLGERTSLLIEPYARIGLNNTTTNNAWFRQKNGAAGISIGLRYKLNAGGQR